MFEERFELLIESGQASEQSVAATRLVIELVEQHYELQLTEGLGSALVNHLAVTLKQILDGKKLVEAPEAVWQELQDHPAEVALAETIVNQLASRQQIALLRDELGFIAIHLCKIKLEAGLEGRR